MGKQQIFMITKRRANKEDMMEITEEFFRIHKSDELRKRRKV